jgi:predicted nucleotide-binding protein (sugar kinase/HSP70/actin superfamily)
MKIGIIKALYYYEYGDLWTYFLTNLGHECVFSEHNGNSSYLCGDEACLPIKMYHSHAQSLISSGADFIFSPKIIKCGKSSFTCPKVIGVNEMLQASLKPVIPLISPEFTGDFKSFFANTGLLLNENAVNIKSALNKTLLYNDRKVVFNSVSKAKNDDNDFQHTVCLLGHKYVVDDKSINMDIKDKLRRLGIRCITSTYFDNTFLTSAASRALSVTPFWITGKQATGLAAACETKADEIDGYIYLSAFGCGPDSFIVPLTKKYVGILSGKPFMEISLDEHTAATGLDTRLEAFIDMIKDRVTV